VLQHFIFARGGGRGVITSGCGTPSGNCSGRFQRFGRTTRDPRRKDFSREDFSRGIVSLSPAYRYRYARQKEQPSLSLALSLFLFLFMDPLRSLEESSFSLASPDPRFAGGEMTTRKSPRDTSTRPGAILIRTLHAASRSLPIDRSRFRFPWGRDAQREGKERDKSAPRVRASARTEKRNTRLDSHFGIGLTRARPSAL